MPRITTEVPRKQVATVFDKEIESLFEDVSDENPYLRVLVYGAPKTGKTTFWTSFPKPILVVLASSGNEFGETISIPKQVRKQVKLLRLSKDVSAAKLLDIAQYQQREQIFKTVVIDHLTGLQDRVLADVLGVGTVPAQKSWGTATQQQFGQAVGQVKELLRALVDCSNHLVLIAQEKQRTIEGDEIPTMIGPDVMPSLATYVNPMCSYLLRTVCRTKYVNRVQEIGGKKITTQVKVPGEMVYSIRVSPQEGCVVGFRRPYSPTMTKLPEYLDNPTYQSLIGLITDKDSNA